MVKRQKSVRTPHRRSVHVSAVMAVIVLIILDQLSKGLAQQFLPGHPVIVIPGIFELLYIENRGAAFGMMENQQWFFVLFALAVMIGCVVYYPRIRKNHRYHALRVCCCLIFAGACGNMIDRLRLHYVIDFLYASGIDFPVFNLADIYVTVGCFWLLICVCFIYREEDILC